MKIACPQCGYENTADNSYVVCGRCATIIGNNQAVSNVQERPSFSAEQLHDLQRRVTKPMSMIPNSSPKAARRDPYATRIEPETDEVLDIPLLSNGIVPVADTGAVLDEVLPIPAQSLAEPVMGFAEPAVQSELLIPPAPANIRAAETLVQPPEPPVSVPQLLEPSVIIEPLPLIESNAAPAPPVLIPSRSAETLLEFPSAAPQPGDDDIVEEIPLEAFTMEPPAPDAAKVAEPEISAGGSVTFQETAEVSHRFQETVSDASESFNSAVNARLEGVLPQAGEVVGNPGDLTKNAFGSVSGFATEALISPATEALTSSAETVAEKTENAFGSLREAVTKNSQEVYDPLRNFIVVEPPPTERPSSLNISEPLPPHSPEMQHTWGVKGIDEAAVAPVSTKSPTLLRALLGLLLFALAGAAAWYFFKDRFMPPRDPVAVAPKPQPPAGGATIPTAGKPGAPAAAATSGATAATNANTGAAASGKDAAGKPGATVSPAANPAAASTGTTAGTSAAAKPDAAKTDPAKMATAPGSAASASGAAAKPAATTKATPLPVPMGPSGPSVSKSDGSLTLQIASYSTQKQADGKAASLKADGAEARVVGVDLPGRGRWYRVQVGRFTSHEEARQFAAKLRARGKVQDFIITGYQGN